SGVYEKYIMDENQNEYHHILDPRTGFPIDNNVISVSVITDSSITADGYSTTLLAVGLEKGMEIVAKTTGLEAVYVVRNNDKYEVYISQGLQDQFEFNENVMNIGYEYKGVFSE
ncbi:MAG: FAD:protein FMN transferase, partial [Bacilli bacterium]